jgi:hypothetical protein
MNKKGLTLLTEVIHSYDVILICIQEITLKIGDVCVEGDTVLPAIPPFCTFHSPIHCNLYFLHFPHSSTPIPPPPPQSFPPSLTSMKGIAEEENTRLRRHPHSICAHEITGKKLMGEIFR